MATTGHLITMCGILFFFLMLIDSHIEKKVSIYSSIGLPRWHKRIQYYIFKIRYYQLVGKKLNKIPNICSKEILKKNYFNEYEIFNKKNVLKKINK